MSVWFAIPSKRKPLEAERCLKLWRKGGYRLALFRDPGDEPLPADILLSEKYPGYHVAVNSLCREILKQDAEAEWIVTGGDDMEPDPKLTPEILARQCTAHFQGTFGIMQPTGDRWCLNDGRICAEQVCGSPWMGRDWCLRMYQGQGPLYSGYWHFFGDEEMQLLSRKYGVLWQRSDVAHYHHHYFRTGQRAPDFHRAATENGMFQRMQKLFQQRKAQGFPGHEPLPLQQSA